MQERRNFIANALELRLSCTNPSIYFKQGTIDCCKQIKDRMNKANLTEGASWEERVLEFHNKAGDLAARAW